MIWIHTHISFKMVCHISVNDDETVVHRPAGPTDTSEFEHSSIPATVKKIFNLKEFLTKRDAWAGTFDVVLNRSTPRTDCPGNYLISHVLILNFGIYIYILT